MNVKMHRIPHGENNITYEVFLLTLCYVKCSVDNNFVKDISAKNLLPLQV